MTFRLVGLMSIVLLLSLASLFLLMNHYQDQVMGELARTVSEVGRATLETLDFKPDPRVPAMVAVDAGPGEHGAVFDRVASPEGMVVFMTTHLSAETPGEDCIMVKRQGEQPERCSLEEYMANGALREGLDLETLDLRLVKVEHHTSGGKQIEITEDVEAREPGGGKIRQTLERRLVTVIKLDEVRAEKEPGGLFMRIPATRAHRRDANEFEYAWSTGPQDATGAGDPGNLMFHEEFRFEVPTEDYQNLFGKLRSRSGFVFLGVFVVGTALSAGLATRFTRPVRRLDAAIHQLSEGDLDVRVPARGGDEMARLGKAFNEMATKLRVNRDRAQELTRREKLASLGRLAAGVAHDVRNPLHSIGLTLQHLQDECRPEADGRAQNFDRSLSIIRGEIQRLDKLVENFLQFARSDRRERALVSLPELARETVRLVEKEAERRGIVVEVEAEGTPPKVEADAEAIRASILNLVLNSLEAMPGGGTLRIRVTAENHEIGLEVSDTGRGIPESEQDKVFDFAYTTRDGGHGLGLAMVHQVVVEEHGGRVSLDSRPGQGTRVTLTLPVKPLSEVES